MTKVRLHGSTEKFAIDEENLYALCHQPFVSGSLLVTATGKKYGTVVPIYSYVYAVGLLIVAAIAGGSPDIDVGDGDNTDRYIDGLGEWATANDIIMAPHCTNTCVAGRYYAAQDSIDVLVNTKADTTGTVKVLVWYSNHGA